MISGEAEATFSRFDEIETRLTTAPRGRSPLFADAEFCATLADRLHALLDGQRILSLDVFDTLVLRDNSSELTRFHEIGGLMAEIVRENTGRDVSQADALVARHLGTRATYRASRPVQGHREGSLTELHRTASRILTGSTDMAEAFIEAELSNEAKRIVPNPFLAAFVAEYRKNGGTVILITDMYMHAAQVADLLGRVGLPADGHDLLVASADTKLSKASGTIFPLIEARLNAGPERFLHLGDSYRGDFAQPIRIGWRAMHLPLARFDIIERRRDHLATEAALAARHGLRVDVAMPG